MEKFIYVFNEKARDELVEAGYDLLKEDAEKKVYIFVNNPFKVFENKNDHDVLYASHLSF